MYVVHVLLLWCLECISYVFIHGLRRLWWTHWTHNSRASSYLAVYLTFFSPEDDGRFQHTLVHWLSSVVGKAAQTSSTPSRYTRWFPKTGALPNHPILVILSVFVPLTVDVFSNKSTITRNSLWPWIIWTTLWMGGSYGGSPWRFPRLSHGLGYLAVRTPQRPCRTSCRGGSPPKLGAEHVRKARGVSRLRSAAPEVTGGSVALGRWKRRHPWWF